MSVLSGNSSMSRKPSRMRVGRGQKPPTSHRVDSSPPAAARAFLLGQRSRIPAIQDVARSHVTCGSKSGQAWPIAPGQVTAFKALALLLDQGRSPSPAKGPSYSLRRRKRCLEP